jgi:hypothetical protein
MKYSHHRETITSTSPYLKLEDPAARKKFKAGDTILVCEKTGEAIAISSIAAYENQCPFCNDNIYESYHTKEHFPGDNYTPGIKMSLPPKTPYPPVDTSYGIWDTLIFCLLFGGGGGLIISFLPLPEGVLQYIAQLLVIGGVMYLSHIVTKQPLGVAFAVTLSNLIPTFIYNEKISMGYIVFLIVAALLSWIISVNIKTVL